MRPHIQYRGLFEYGWLAALTRGNPLGFFNSVEKMIEASQGEKFKDGYLKIRIEPNVAFKRGIPIYSKPLKTDIGFGYVTRGIDYRLMILGVGTEFVITAVHEYLHILYPNYEYQSVVVKHQSLHNLGGERYRKQLFELNKPWENLIELTAQSIVWDWHLAGDITWESELLTQQLRQYCQRG